MAGETLRVLQCGFRVVDRARAGDHQQAVVGAIQDSTDFVAARRDRAAAASGSGISAKMASGEGNSR